MVTSLIQCWVSLYLDAGACLYSKMFSWGWAPSSAREKQEIIGKILNLFLQPSHAMLQRMSDESKKSWDKTLDKITPIKHDLMNSLYTRLIAGVTTKQIEMKYWLSSAAVLGTVQRWCLFIFNPKIIYKKIKCIRIWVSLKINLPTIQQNYLD